MTQRAVVTGLGCLCGGQIAHFLDERLKTEAFPARLLFQQALRLERVVVCGHECFPLGRNFGPPNAAPCPYGTAPGADAARGGMDDMD